ncbi:hypothetical protein WS68_00155 [Burkholderia sp. TSV86]|nr:hypothetical protein WS68_00155 [Burkholderia sp. TSV86]
MTRRPRGLRAGAPAKRDFDHRRALMPQARRGPAETQREPHGGARARAPSARRPALPVRPLIKRTFTT